MTPVVKKMILVLGVVLGVGAPALTDHRACAGDNCHRVASRPSAPDAPPTSSLPKIHPPRVGP